MFVEAVRFPYTTNHDISTRNLEKLQILNTYIQEVSSTTTFIAGGAVRDTVYGLNWKDIDVFVDYNHTEQCPEDYCLNLAYDLSNALGGTEPSLSQAAEAYQHNKDTDLWVIYDFTWNQSKVQVIGRPDVTTPEEFVQGFDYELVKTWINSDGTIGMAPEFVEAIEYRKPSYVLKKEAHPQSVLIDAMFFPTGEVVEKIGHERATSFLDRLPENVSTKLRQVANGDFKPKPKPPVSDMSIIRRFQHRNKRMG